ncbi:ArsR/SmtB family transcription factor [Clostridioides sp. ZZV14-6345]|uniref:ArsR/SmtB family transcription factor n=1 Tax=Clostridioides sp. ZZV14-6345 TaxID=2811496 RepID=UPI001D12C26B|nr:winged helix-turn-helix transcriptional regulator [Clostridioides sp. ZZV14-6345]
MKNHNDIEKCELVFKSLSDSIRLNILLELNKKESICVCELVEYFDMPQSKLSYHLKMLLDANLIIKERQGKWNYYSINMEELEAFLSKELILKIF